MAEINLKKVIAGIVLAILMIFLTIFAGFNKYLFANTYFLMFYFTVAALLISISIVIAVELYKEKYQRKKDEEDRKELNLRQLVREKLEFAQKASELQEKVDQKAERERQLEFEERELELARQRLALEKERTSYALEAAKTAREMVDLLYPDISPEAKATIVNNLIPTLLHYSDLGTFEQIQQKLMKEA